MIKTQSQNLHFFIFSIRSWIWINPMLLTTKYICHPSQFLYPRVYMFIISSPSPAPFCLLLELRTRVCVLGKGALSSGWMQLLAKVCVLWAEPWLHLAPSCRWFQHLHARHTQTVRCIIPHPTKMLIQLYLGDHSQFKVTLTSEG